MPAGSPPPRVEHAGAMSEPLPIVDTHQHLWDLARFTLPWHAHAPACLAQSFLPRDYAAATRGLNVVTTVYMEVDVAPEQHVAEAEYVLDLCRRDDNPLAGAVIACRPESPDFPEYAARWRDEPFIKGYRRVLHGPNTPRGHSRSEQFVASVRRIGEHGKSYDVVHRPEELADSLALVDACPETRFVLDHCGNVNVRASDREQWRRDLAAIARRPNVVCKVSGIIASADPLAWRYEDLAPIVRHVIAEFGWERVMFAGDWPVCTPVAPLRQWMECLRWIVRAATPAQQRALFHDNAVSFYGLE